MLPTLLPKLGILAATWLTLWGGAIVGIWNGLVVVAALVVIGAVLLAQGMMWGGMFIGLAFLSFGLGFRNVPSNPPHKALVTFWGTRRKTVLGEGYTVIAPYFPFFYDIIPVNIEQKNQDFKFDELRCNAQGQFQGSASVSVKVGITWQPDERGEYLYNYVGVGKENGTWSILRDMMAEALRQYVAPKTWQELAHAGPEITQTLLQKLTNHTGSTIAPGGLPDILGLGIVITRLNVGEIIPEGRTVEATEQASSTEILLQTAVMLKKAYEQAGETRTLDECIVEARRVLATQTGGGNFVDVPGLGSIIQGLGHR